MIEGIPRISVLIITYKQQDLINRAINSLLAQKDYIYEICVSDDCSPDNTWKVLLDYDKKYPGLFKLSRNNPNVGIFENIEFSWTMPSGDIIYQLAGDDSVPEGWFKSVVEYIQNKNIDYKKELFCIYGDYVVMYPNGDSYVRHNNSISKYPNQALSLAFRGLICNRGCCYSIKVLQKFEKVSQGRSHIAEFLQDRLLQINSEKNYYIPQEANLYYAAIGVSAHLDEKSLNERKKIRPYAETFIENKGIKISSKEKYFGKYMAASADFKSRRTFSNFYNAIRFYYASFDFRFGFLGDNLRFYLFAIKRRLPHSKPIAFK